MKGPYPSFNLLEERQLKRNLTWLIAKRVVASSDETRQIQIGDIQVFFYSIPIFVLSLLYKKKQQPQNKQQTQTDTAV